MKASAIKLTTKAAVAEKAVTQSIHSRPKAFGLYSAFDQFQLKLTNLDPKIDYSFLNSLPITDPLHQYILNETIRNVEASINNHIQNYLHTRIFRVVVNNMAYSPSSNSILVSFVIVLDPDIRLMEEANIFLNIFNTLIYNNVGFNDIKFFNDITCISSLLPNISLFSCKFISHPFQENNKTINECQNGFTIIMLSQ